MTDQNGERRIPLRVEPAPSAAPTESMRTITADSTPRPRVPNTTGEPELDARIRELVDSIGGEKPRELIVEMVMTALKMSRDQTSVADLKMLNRALKEMRFASRVFEPYRAKRKVSV